MYACTLDSHRLPVGGALNALKFPRAQRDSLSELFLYENMSY